MKSSKLLLTSLLAAAAMSVPAWATTYNDGAEHTVNSSETGDLIVNGGSTVNIVDAASTVTLSSIKHSSGNDAATVNVGDGTGATTVVTTRVEMGDANVNVTSALSVLSGSTLVITGSNNGNNYKNASLLLGEWGAKTTLTVSGMVLAQSANALAGDSGMALNVSGGTLAVKGIGISQSGKSPASSLSISENGKLILGDAGISHAAGTWSSNLGEGTIGLSAAETTIANALNFTDSTTGTTFDTTQYAFSGEGAAQTISQGANGGTIKITGTLSGSGIVKVTGSGVLDLSGATVSLSSAIQNSSTVTVSAGTVFNLTQVGANTLISNINSGSILGWTLLGIGNFTYNGAAITVGRGLTSSAEGVVNYDDSAVAKALTWDGRASSTWKDAGISENPEKPWTSSDGEEAFYRGDSVAFSISADTAITVSGTVAPSNFTANVAEAKTLTFSGGTVNISGTFSKTGTGTLAIESGTLAVAAPDVTLVSEGKITLAAGTTLDYGSSSLANNVTRDLSAVEGVGTILYKTQTHSASGGDYGNNKVTLSDDFTGDFVVGETGVQWIMADGSNFGGATIVLKGSSLLIAANEDVVISNAVRLDGPAAIWADRSADRHFTLNGGVSGSGAFTKAGDGTVTLGGTSTFTGNLTVAGGTLELVGTRTSTSGSVTINSGATLDIGNATGKLYATGDPYVSSPRITIAGTLKVYDYTYGGSLGNLLTNGNGTNAVKLDGGTLVFTHSHEAKRGTDVTSNGGTVSVDAGVEITLIGNDYGNAFTTNGGTLRLGGAGNLTLSGTNGIVTGSAAVEKFGAGTVTFSGANTYTGATTVSAGRLVASNANALSATASLTVADGAEISTAGNAVVLGATGATITINGTYIVTAGGSLASDGAITIGSTGKIDISGLESGEYTIFVGTGAVSGLASGNIVDAGRGGRDTIALASDSKSFTLTRGAVYNLTWTSETGTWDTNTTWQNNDASSSVPNPTFADGDTVTFTASETAATAISVVGAKEAKAVNVTGGNYTFSAGTGGSLSVRDALTISGASTTLTLNSGLLGTVGDGIVISDGGKLIMGTGASLGANNVDLSGGTLEADGHTLSGLITGSGTLSKVGTGTLFVTNNTNDISGTVSVAAGVLIVGAANTGGTGAVARLSSAEAPASIVVESGAAFKTHLGGGAPQNDGNVVATSSEEFAGNFYLKDGATLGNIDGHVALTGDIVFGATDMTGAHSESSTVTLTQYWQKTVELAGVLSGAGTVKLTSPAAQPNAFYKISGDENTFSGTYKLENATNKTSTLVLSSQNAAKDAKVNLSTSGARIFLGAANVTIAGLGGVSGSTIQLTTESGAPSASTLTVNQATNTTFAGTIAVGVALVKTGAGTLTLSGDNSANSSGVMISQGVLAAAHANAFGSTAAQVKLSGGQLKVGNGVTLAQTSIEIVLSDAYSSTAAITGAGELAAGATITIADIQAAALVAESALANDSWTFQIATAGSTIADSLAKENFVLAEALQGTWQISDYANGMLTLTIPEPSVFGLLAGLGALALAGTRRRRKKA